VSGLAVGQLAVESDCSKAVVFQISSISSSSLFFDSVSAANSAAGTTMGNTSSTLPVTFDYSQVFVPTTSIFYIGVGADGDGALYRGDLTFSAGAYTLQANEIVPDVENMQIVYGADPNTTHAATQYTTADKMSATCPANPNGTNSFNCVDSIQVSFLVASPLQTVQPPDTAATITMPNGTVITPPADSRQRTVYQVTVALRNILP
jgi:type IV pilus assembly protein PilW